MPPSVETRQTRCRDLPEVQGLHTASKKPPQKTKKVDLFSAALKLCKNIVYAGYLVYDHSKKKYYSRSAEWIHPFFQFSLTQFQTAMFTSTWYKWDHTFHYSTVVFSLYTQYNHSLAL